MAKKMILFVALVSVLLLATCVAPVKPTPTTTREPSVTAGISIEGQVRLNGANGPGLAGVKIYGKGGYGSTEGDAQFLATTDADGYYWNGNAIPGMIVWAELDGYVFEPVSQVYMMEIAGMGQPCTDACDFIATKK